MYAQIPHPALVAALAAVEKLHMLDDVRAGASALSVEHDRLADSGYAGRLEKGVGLVMLFYGFICEEDVTEGF